MPLVKLCYPKDYMVLWVPNVDRRAIMLEKQATGIHIAADVFVEVAPKEYEFAGFAITPHVSLCTPSEN